MIEIVSHAYAVKLPQYAVMLRAQLSSIAKNCDGVDVKMTVICTPKDDAVVKVLADFQSVLGDRLNLIHQTPEALFRRAIGRNLAARKTIADLVWFADCDMLFGASCLKHLWMLWQELEEKPIMVWPEEIQIHKNHSTGDKFWQAHVESTGTIFPYAADFVSKTYYKAIGGVQIVDGQYCRDHGYLHDYPKWLTPTDGLKPFPSFNEDVKFRGLCESRGVVQRIKLPNLYRLRHSAITYRGC